MPPAVIAAAVGGAAALGGAVISSNATSKATKAATAANEQNNALAREQRAADQANFQPYLDAGYGSLEELMRAVGVTPRGATGSGAAGGTDWRHYVNGQPDVQANWNALSAQERAQFNNDPAQFGQYHYQQSQQLGEQRDLTPYTSQPGSGASTGFGPTVAPRVEPGARPDPTRPTATAAALPTRATPAARPEITQRGAAEGFQASARPELGARPAIGAPAASGATAGASGALSGYNPSGAEGGGSYGTPAPTAPASSGMSGPSYGDRPAIQGYTQGAAPSIDGFTFRERSADPTLNIGMDAYTASPDYNYQQQQGARSVLANYAAFGGVESGAAMKALQQRGQDIAMGDYGQWRDYTTGQYNTDRTVGDLRYEGDRGAALTAWGTEQTLEQQAYDNREGRALSAWGTTQGLNQAGYTADAARQSGDWQARLADTGATTRTGMQEAGATQRTGMQESGASSRAALAEAGTSSRYYAGLTQAAYDSDADRAARAYEYDTGLSADMYRFGQTQADSRYVYDTGRADSAYEYDAARGDRAYEFDTGTALDMYRYETDRGDDIYTIDRARGDAIYDTALARQDTIYGQDRAYDYGAYTDRLNLISGIAGMGQQAAGSIAGSGQAMTQAQMSNNSSLAGVQGNAAIAGANNVNNLMGSALNAYALYRGSTGSPATTSTARSTYPYGPQI